MLRKKEKDVLAFFSTHDLELSARPFAQAGRRLGIPETEIVDILRRLQKRGLIKNLRGVINQHKAGYITNALIAWRRKAQPAATNKKCVTDEFVLDKRISHCYQRKPHKQFNYDLYTMMHAKTPQEVKNFTRTKARKHKLDYSVLFTEKELKKEKLNLKDLL